MANETPETAIVHELMEMVGANLESDKTEPKTSDESNSMVDDLIAQLEEATEDLDAANVTIAGMYSVTDSLFYIVETNLALLDHIVTTLANADSGLNTRRLAATALIEWRRLNKAKVNAESIMESINDGTYEEPEEEETP